MPSPEKLDANRKLYSSLLLEQVQPYLTGKPRVWAKTFGDTFNFSQAFGVSTKTMFLPFAKAKIPTDCRVFHYLPTTNGEAYAVLHFSGFALQPTDYIFIYDCNIPRAAFLRKAKGSELTDKWATSLTEEGKDDPFATYLSGLERKGKLLPDAPHYYANWKYPLGKLSVEVPYTMALISLGDGRTAFLFKRNYLPGLFSVKKSKFDVELVWRIADWIYEALAAFNYQGDPPPLEVPVPAGSLLALPEIAPLFENQGQDVPFEMDLSPYAVSTPVKATPQIKTNIAEEYKYCIQCGTKLINSAAFCQKCGSKQE